MNQGPNCAKVYPEGIQPIKGNKCGLMILHGPSMFAVKAKIIECYIIKPAQSLLVKHLVIGQR